MDKQEFIKEIKDPLKARGYIKHNNYWYKSENEIMVCMNVQGSQWNKDDYYVELGLSSNAANTTTPTVSQWLCRHRCNGTHGEKNIRPEVLFEELDNLQRIIMTTPLLSSFIETQGTKKVGHQFWF